MKKQLKLGQHIYILYNTLLYLKSMTPTAMSIALNAYSSNSCSGVWHRVGGEESNLPFVTHGSRHHSWRHSLCIYMLPWLDYACEVRGQVALKELQHSVLIPGHTQLLQCMYENSGRAWYQKSHPIHHRMKSGRRVKIKHGRAKGQWLSDLCRFIAYKMSKYDHCEVQRGIK